MVKKARTHNADAERELANMADGVILTRALVGIAEVKVWKLETLSAAGDDVDELERVGASADSPSLSAATASRSSACAILGVRWRTSPN